MLNTTILFALISSIGVMQEKPSDPKQMFENNQKSLTKTTMWDPTLGLNEAKNWKNRIYLATYPRSGNHWIRYLIEEVTHIATSSVYRDKDPNDSDPEHLPDIFPWGGYCSNHGYKGNCVYPSNGETVVVKTHFPALGASLFDKLPYNLTIRIIRHPVDSFYSFYLWFQAFQHPLPPRRMIPRNDLLQFIQSWRQFQKYWDQADNVLTIRYEDLYNDPAYYLRLVMQATGYPFNQEDIERAIAKYPPMGGLLKYHQYFTREDLLIIQTELGDLMQQYGYELKKSSKR